MSSIVYYPYTAEKISLRCSTTNLTTVIESLNDTQKEAVRNMNFGDTLFINLHTIPTRFGFYLLKNYDTTNDIVNDGKMQFKVTPELIHEVFGIPLGKMKVKTKLKPNVNDMVVKEWRSQFGKKIGTKLMLKQFKDYLVQRQDSGRIFRMNYLVMFFTVMGEAMKSNTINQRFLTSLTKKVDVNNFNWCEYMLDCLRKSRNDWLGVEDQLYNGPLLLLVVDILNLL